MDGFTTDLWDFSGASSWLWHPHHFINEKKSPNNDLLQIRWDNAISGVEMEKVVGSLKNEKAPLRDLTSMA